MSNALSDRLEATRILFDLQQGTEIVQSLAGCLEPEEIARRVTDGLVARFDCAFARLWLLEEDLGILKLVASSGLYTHTNGSFSRVPMGAYKVGKIAQNRVSFLSNNLPQESWVGDRDWAIANNMNGFAGYPLTVGERVVGVLAFFSHGRLEPEFLEVLQTLCAIATIALDNAIQYQKEKQIWLSHPPTVENPVLSDRLVSILKTTRLTLIGTERSLSPPVNFLFLQVAECLKQSGCSYGRLIYAEESVTLEALVPTMRSKAKHWLQVQLEQLNFMLRSLGGAMRVQISPNNRAIEVVLSIPYVCERDRQVLSEREVEILTLLTRGDRDRDIADRLVISESTVKFHINSVMAKLKVRTRYQAIHQALINGWIQ
ncbi:LuxR C-terminal-related transcriptional regulator [Pseudanabaena sp. PCC 6802]|uniref:LuxR C-terminal-related transcriptional regulator n=1 Tax=Pseudanabaena sp. PCC 6802 TaxID=118173 RepID=UPI0003460B73|nr:LuxR C-terminal-related transcriptional regulator [Pseudanabaena sp. PCC 6802]